ncbi:MAG: biopolymer transporter ExbD [Planctomycetes bacterium]|nr:biopolymer transporter ExbD [Planctomycetota bacterium]MCH9724831.1 biopolymer transporter ExbD [Planctomycetota bacterium]MCH9778771.1 biopolymer transporter ExbD [Planctomycetota bacterium]MCH9791026.1 biopolymer transporter ExbD [Planctomycetota bacterium]MDF1745697.1 biopolymer transporter ExbD [Gimesia sp.]
MAKKKAFLNTDEDGWKKRPAAGGAGDDLDITPMIDVTFLLLIFFMVTSTMQATQDSDVPVARYGVGVDTRGATIVLVHNDGNGINGTSVIEVKESGGTTEVTTEELTARVREKVQNGVMDVIIKADRGVPHGFVQEVTRAVTEVDGVKFFIGIEEKKNN